MAVISIHHVLGKSVQLSQDSAQVFTLDYSSSPKPFFHPFCTATGRVLSNFQPSDHYWHRGLWFAIKFVNDENFWEEGDSGPQNVQLAVRPPSIDPTKDGGVKITIELEWTRHEGHVVMDERRTVVFHPIDDTTYFLDHSSHITPREAVKLDRTPFTTWGGYGGPIPRNSELDRLFNPPQRRSDYRSADGPCCKLGDAYWKA